MIGVLAGGRGDHAAEGRRPEWSGAGVEEQLHREAGRGGADQAGLGDRW